MSLIDLQTSLEQLASPLGVQVVSLSWTTFNGNKVLELLIDHPDGVDVDLCASVSELLIPTVDQYMVEEENFYFEVASSGVEQPIKTLAALTEALGAWIHVELHTEVDGMNTYEGTLLEVNGTEFVLEYQEKARRKTLRTQWDNVQTARYAVKL